MDGGEKAFGTAASSLLQWYCIVRLTCYLYPHYRRSDTPLSIIINASSSTNQLALPNHRRLHVLSILHHMSSQQAR